MSALITTLGTITLLVILGIVGAFVLAALGAAVRVVYLFTRDNPDVMWPVLGAFVIGFTFCWWL